jgi:hypothetical protein
MSEILDILNVDEWRPRKNKWFAKQITNDLLKNNVPYQQLHNRRNSRDQNKSK